MIAAGVIAVVGAFLLAALFGVLDSDGQSYDAEMEYGDWMEYDTSRILGTEGPIEVEHGMIHAVGTGTARIVGEDGGAFRIRIVQAHAVLVLMNGQSNAAYYKADGKLPDASDLAVTPVPEIGTCFYFGTESRMPYRESDDVSGCRILDFVDPATGAVRVGDKGPGFCREYHEATGKKILWVSLGIPSKRIAAWDQPDGSAWTQDIRIMDAFNSELKDTGFVVDRTIVLWSQGESDYLHSTGYSRYIQRFEDLHDAAPAAWGHEISAWYLLEGRTEKVGWVNDAFRELARDIGDVELATGSVIVDAFTTANGFMEEDGLHYSQLGDNALANAAARFAAGAGGIAPIFLMESLLAAAEGSAAEAPETAKLHRTDGSDALAVVAWDSEPDLSEPGTFVIEGTPEGVTDAMLLPFTPRPMLIVTVEASA